jgi:hypothetical protein
MKRQLILLCSGMIFATQICGAATCVTDFFATYDAPGFTCSLDSLTFGAFKLSATGTSLPLPNDLTVLVIPISGGGSDGLQFQGPFGASAGQSLDVGISFVVTSNPGVISGDALAIQGFGTSGGGSVQVTESMCVGAIPTSSGNCTGSGGTLSLDVFANAGGNKPFDSVSFSPVDTLAVSKDVIVLGGAGGTPSAAGVSLVINTNPSGGTPRLGDAPEPTSMSILGGGSLLILLIRRRRKTS